MMSKNIFERKRNIDMVFCIDGTGSMSPCIDKVKDNAMRFHMEFAGKMIDMGSEIDSMRVKVIVFRDYESEKEEAIIESPFFELPDDNAEFSQYMARISATGGGDYAENGLEALYYAMKTDFTATAPKDREVIVLFSDADALELRERACCSGYPDAMVDEDGLIELWAGASQEMHSKLKEANKRLVMFAPDGSKYKALKSKLNRSVFEPVNMSDGLGDIDFSDIIKIIAASASSV